jgi:hypothetical protein
MPIDPVGKGGGIPPQAPGGATGPDVAAPTKTFEVGAAGPAGAAQKADATQAVASGPLEALRAGTIDVSQYVDLKVDEATSHLKGLHAAELAHIRETLRDKMVHDPQIADLVRQAAGSVPTPRDE